MVDQAPALGFGGAELLASQGQLHGQVVGDALGQAHQPARAGHQAALDLGQAKTRVVGGHDQVAGQHHFKTTGQGVAFHGGNQGFDGRGLDHASQAPARQLHPLAAQKSLEVHARAKVTACAREDAHAECGVGVQQVHGLGQGLGGGAVNGVAHLGAVYGDDQKRATALKVHAVAGQVASVH